MAVDAKIEEISDHEGHDHADHEGHDHEHSEVTQESGRQQSRAEKKARKALAKLGLKPVKGITRVVLKRPKGIMFTLTAPDVFKSTVADTYLIFGEARIEDMSGTAQTNAAQSFKPVEESSIAAAVDEEAPELEEIDGDEALVDEDGVNAKDIELVMKNAGVSRAKAVQAIKNNNNDIVNAIMELSM